MRIAGAATATAVGLALLALPSILEAAGTPHDTAPPGATTDGTAQRALAQKYCFACHSNAAKVGGLSLEAARFNDMALDADTFEKVVRKVRAGMMPPRGMPRPDKAEMVRFASAIEANLDAHAAQHPEPGSPGLHRLNRTEYGNAVRDLLALDADVSTLLPADDSKEGFDNIADVLSISPTLIQGYVSAAMKLSRLSVGDRTAPPARATYRAEAGLAQDKHIEGLPLGTRGGLTVTHNFPLDADYEFQVNWSVGGGFLAAPGNGAVDPHASDLVVTVNGQPVETKNPGHFVLRLKAGPQEIGAALLDRQRPAGVDDVYSVYSVGGGVQSIVVIGPNNATGAGDTPSRRRIFICHPGPKASAAEEKACAQRILARLATHAYRRPVTGADALVKPLMAAYDEGRKDGDFESGVEHGVARILIDPRFLFRIEQEDPKVAAGQPYRINDLELASRLSFFLWSTIPDDALLQLAARNQLHEPAVLEKQVRRMLADRRSEQLVENFAGQWLMLRDLASSQPDVSYFDANLRDSFRKETEMLFGSVVKEDRKVTDLLDADYTFVDERLARHYGIPDVHGSYMRRITLPKDSPRRGLLGQGSILTATSVADRTSPVTRGKWVVENLLGVPVPAPPPGVQTDFVATSTLAGPQTLRQRFEDHRKNPVCASCHQIMDPIGFALEPFDLTGKLRDKDSGLPIDASGQLQDGTPINGPAGLRQALLDRKDSFVSTLTQKMMTYGVGRTLTYADMPSVRAAVRQIEAKDDRFSELVLAVVRSPEFQMRQKGGAGPAGPKTLAGDGAPRPASKPAPNPAKYGFNDIQIFHRKEAVR
jgi:cytochrome c551/c552